MQILLSSISIASWYSLLGLAFFITLKTHGFINITIAAFFISGPYIALLFKNWIGIHFSCFASIIVVLLIALFIELVIIRALRNRKASSIILLLSTFGIYIIIENVISMYFGDDTKILRDIVVASSFPIQGAILTVNQIANLVTAACLFLVYWLFVGRTRMGKALLATASDFELAVISGVRVARIQIIGFMLSAGLAATAGILVALDTDMVPTMGIDPLLFGIVSALVGGSHKIYAVILGAFILSFAQNMAIWYVGPKWYEASAFAILLMLLLLKPVGLFGKNHRKINI